MTERNIVCYVRVAPPGMLNVREELVKLAVIPVAGDWIFLPDREGEKGYFVVTQRSVSANWVILWVELLSDKHRPL